MVHTSISEASTNFARLGLIMVAILVSATAFTSCSDDDDDSDNYGMFYKLMD